MHLFSDKIPNLNEKNILARIRSNQNYLEGNVISLTHNTLNELGVKNKVLEGKIHELSSVKLPCLALTKKSELLIIKQVDDKTVAYENHKKKRFKSSLSEFDTIWSNIVFSLNMTDINRFAHAASSKSQPKIFGRIERLCYSLVTFLVAFGWFWQTSPPPEIEETWQLLLTVKAVGLGLSLVLVSFYFRSSMTLHYFCGLGERFNCDDVLNSPASHIGKVPVADIGLLYFLGGLIALIFTNSIPELTLILTILALPYTLFSISYQAFIIKKWCWLCLSIQLVLWVELAILIFKAKINFLSLLAPAYQITLESISAYAIPSVIWLILAPVIKGYNKGQVKITSLKEIALSKSAITHQLAQTQPVSLEASEDLSLEFTLGNINSTTNIMLVTDPECPMCAEKFLTLSSLITQYSEEMSLTIRLYCPDEEGYAIGEHVFGHIHNNSQNVAYRALKSWFDNTSQSIDKWKKQNPIKDKEALYAARKSISAQAYWYDQTERPGTPDIFINGKPLNAAYFSVLEEYINSLITLEV